MKYSVLSKMGSLRERNEDACAVTRQGIFVVADGVGGSTYGEVASKIAVTTISHYLTSHYPSLKSRPQPTMINAVKETNREIIKQGLMDPRLIGMASTIVAAFLDGKRAHLVSVGDSRAYLFRPPSMIKRLTKDHSILQELKEHLKSNQEILPAKSLNHIITQWLGSRKISPYYSSISLRREDYVLLCTEGLTGTLSDTQIMNEIMSGSTLEKINQELASAAQEEGGNDDITIVIARLGYSNRKSKKRLLHKENPVEPNARARAA